MEYKILDPSIDTSKPAGTDYDFYDNVPLGTGQYAIRILTLAPGQMEEPIECTLESSTLENKPQFEALSYCWGPDDSLQLVRVNGAKLFVTPNLRLALQYLRQQDRPRRLWIDRLCINQYNNLERARQVSIMRQIYAAAETTIAWLGAPSREIENAFTMVEGHFSMAESSKPDWRKKAGTKVHSLKYHVKYKKASFASDKDRQRVLSALYFTRAWMLQETATSQSVLLQCGHSLAPLRSFLKKYHISDLTGGYSTLANSINYLSEPFDDSWMTRGNCFSILDGIDFTSTSLPLSLCLSYFRTFRVGRPVDKLFALYGLAQDDVRTLNLRPDYASQPHQVYTDVAFAMLDGLHDISILEVPRGSSHLRSDLPSWVPDYNDSSHLPEGLTVESQATRNALVEASCTVDAALGRTSSGGQHDPQRCKDCAKSVDLSPNLRVTQRFHAAGNSVLTFVKKKGMDTICISGLFVDTIAEVSDVIDAVLPQTEIRVLATLTAWRPSQWTLLSQDFLDRFEKPVLAFEMLLDWHQRHVMSCLAAYPTGEARLEAFLQTICTGSVPDGCSFANLQQLREFFNDFRERWIAHAKKYYDIGRYGGLGFGEILKHASGIASELVLTAMGMETLQVYSFAMSVLPLCKRRLAMTSKGLFGLVPNEALVNDRVVILEGSNIPLIVRPKDDGTYQLVGESYVHGIMHGEAWDASLCTPIAIS